MQHQCGPQLAVYEEPMGCTSCWQAPSEAEAQCAVLAREGVVYGTATEDMDALTFQTPKLLRRMTFSGASQPIVEIDYQKLLQVLWRRPFFCLASNQH